VVCSSFYPTKCIENILPHVITGRSDPGYFFLKMKSSTRTVWGASGSNFSVSPYCAEKLNADWKNAREYLNVHFTLAI
jgi:hypothetical protein